MSYKDFYEDIQSGQLKTLYIFYGPERLMVDRMLETCRQRCLSPATVDFNYVVAEADQLSFSQIFNQIEMLPMMDARRILVLKNPGFLAKDLWSEGQLRQFLDFHSASDCATTTIMWAESVDKRKRLVKDIGKIGRLIGFERLDEVECAKWLRQESKRLEMAMSAGVSQHFVQRSGYLHQDSEIDLYQMLSWLARLAGTCRGTEVTARQVDEILDQAVEANVFKWVDAVFEGQGKLATTQQEALLANDEAPLKLLFMLHRHLRQLYKVKLLLDQGFSQTSVADELAIKPFVVKKSAGQVARISFQGMSDLMEVLQQADLWMKSSSMSPETILDYAVGNILTQIKQGQRPVR